MAVAKAFAITDIGTDIDKDAWQYPEAGSGAHFLRRADRDGRGASPATFTTRYTTGTAKIETMPVSTDGYRSLANPADSLGKHRVLYQGRGDPIEYRKQFATGLRSAACSIIWAGWRISSACSKVHGAKSRGDVRPMTGVRQTGCDDPNRARNESEMAR